VCALGVGRWNLYVFTNLQDVTGSFTEPRRIIYRYNNIIYCCRSKIYTPRNIIFPIIYLPTIIILYTYLGTAVHRSFHCYRLLLFYLSQSLLLSFFPPGATVMFTARTRRPLTFCLWKTSTFSQCLPSFKI